MKAKKEATARRANDNHPLGPVRSVITFRCLNISLCLPARLLLGREIPPRGENSKRIVCINDGAIWIWMMVFVYFSRRKVLSYISRNCYF